MEVDSVQGNKEMVPLISEFLQKAFGLDSIDGLVILINSHNKKTGGVTSPFVVMGEAGLIVQGVVAAMKSDKAFGEVLRFAVRHENKLN